MASPASPPHAARVSATAAAAAVLSDQQIPARIVTIEGEFDQAQATAVLGAVEGCYRSYVEAMRDRIRLSLGGGRFVEDQFSQVAVARAADELVGLLTAPSPGLVPGE